MSSPRAWRCFSAAIVVGRLRLRLRATGCAATTITIKSTAQEATFIHQRGVANGNWTLEKRSTRRTLGPRSMAASPAREVRRSSRRSRSLTFTLTAQHNGADETNAPATCPPDRDRGPQGRYRRSSHRGRPRSPAQHPTADHLRRQRATSTSTCSVDVKRSNGAGLGGASQQHGGRQGRHVRLRRHHPQPRRR